MNKERLELVVMVKDLLDALPPGRKLPRINRVLTKTLVGIKSSEDRAVRAMEPHKDASGTVANYTKAVKCAALLDKAREAVSVGDYDSGIEALERIEDVMA